MCLWNANAWRAITRFVWQLARYEPSSPSTKELHGIRIPTTYIFLPLPKFFFKLVLQLGQNSFRGKVLAPKMTSLKKIEAKFRSLNFCNANHVQKRLLLTYLLQPYLPTCLCHSSLQSLTVRKCNIKQRWIFALTLW